ncbi:MAG: hypothetical protein ACKVQC_03065 [Elusimicrobiota bacterium]
MNYNQLKKVFQQIQIVRAPRHRLATFGTSRIQYQLVTDVSGFHDRSRLRIGTVVAERPLILTPNKLLDIFGGFSDEAQSHSQSFLTHYGDVLKGLQYQFKNELGTSKVELFSPEECVKNLVKNFDREDAYNKTIITGQDKSWELSLMKFIVEETISSFSTNLQELKERGFFDGEDRELKRQKLEIKNLITKAKIDPVLIPELGKKLKEYGLFDQYQDQFFRLIK